MRPIVSGKLLVAPLHTDGGFWKRLFTPKSWEHQRKLTIQLYGLTMIMFAGEQTDFASVPRIMKWMFQDDAIYSIGSVAHDHLYRHGGTSKWMADAIFYELLRSVDEINPVTAALMWLGVTLFGWGTWNGYRKPNSERI
jgi:hypothetical protein